MAFANGYSFRRKITIDSTKISADLTDYPLLFNQTIADLKTTANGGDVTDANGYDIIFTDTSDVQLDHEIEKYDGTTGEFIAWVRVPSVSSTVDTDIYIYYGNSSISTSQESVDTTWESSFKGVWHMDGTDESSGNTQTLTDSGTVDVSGIAGQARDFDGTDYMYRDAVSATLQNDPITIELFVNPDADDSVLIDMGDGTAGGYNEYFVLKMGWNGTYDLMFRWNSSPNIYTADNAVGANAWYYIVITKDWGADNQAIYVNGVSQSVTTSGTMTDLPQTAADDFGLGCLRSNAVFTELFDGQMDEVRISSGIKSAAYITANDYGIRLNTLITVAAEETPPVTLTYTADGIVAERITSTYTADGIVKVLNNTETYTADGIVKAETTKEYTADGIVKVLNNTKTYTADGIVKVETTTSYTADGVIKARYEQTYTADGIVKVLGNTKTYTADGIVKVLNNTETYTADGIVKVLDNTKTYTADGIVKEQITLTYTADGIVKVVNIENTYTADGIVKVETTNEYTADGIIAIRTANTYTADGIVKVTDITNTYTADGIVKVLNNTETYTADGIVKVTNIEKTYTADGIVKVVDIEKTYTADGIVKVLNNTFTYTADGIVKVRYEKEYTADGIVKVLNNTKTYTADGIVKVRTTHEYTADGIVKVRNITKTYTADGIVKVLNNVEEYTADGIVKVRNITKTYTADGIIAIRRTHTYTADGIVGAARTKTYTADGIVWERYAVKPSIVDTVNIKPKVDSINIKPKVDTSNIKPGASDTISADAVIP